MGRDGDEDGRITAQGRAEDEDDFFFQIMSSTLKNCHQHNYAPQPLLQYFRYNLTSFKSLPIWTSHLSKRKIFEYFLKMIMVILMFLLREYYLPPVYGFLPRIVSP